ncbi:hypothetical protein G647_05585 [Cladophialophora carrionii CBS 160.54]|uniref:Redoxin domain-containing protein n=1 Tax=Cladophialophora carrionii CBS 160.54 TaxID=1279043 RepID=V9DA27_9EURO|nr:uncharacterized protein G647_05585 [Cladophialophora carrionii CBS 160.54]ETI23779.1 hypothetical protein G647_05585 [Cladophialophora carrionii CBS 160.54]
MAGLKEGDQFPDNVVFSYIPYTPESADITSCGIPQNYNASKEWADKKVVLFAVPGAFTPGCSVRHLPGYIQALQELKGKSVDVVAVLAYNDAFVMSAWGKANGIKDEIVSQLFFSTCRGCGEYERGEQEFLRETESQTPAMAYYSSTKDIRGGILLFTPPITISYLEGLH